MNEFKIVPLIPSLTLTCSICGQQLIEDLELKVHRHDENSDCTDKGVWYALEIDSHGFLKITKAI